MQQLEQGILIEDGYLGVTVGSICMPQGVVLIDAPLRSEDIRLWRSIVFAQRYVPLRLLVVLDAHVDRTLGARSMECAIVAHTKVAQAFRNRPSIFKGQTVETGAAWETYNEAIGMRWSPPDITFSERMSIHLDNLRVDLEPRAGPSPGAVWAIIPSAKVIFVGDAITLNQPPFLAQADLESWLAALNELETSYSDFRIVSGRGGLASLDDVRMMRKFLQDILKFMGQLSRKKAPAEATQEIIPSLLARYSVKPPLDALYTARLRYGLHQCYNRRYRQVGAVGRVETQEEES